MDRSSKIYIAGHTGLVGSAIVDELTRRGYNNLVTASSKELDLTDQKETEKFISKHKPEFVFHAAGVVGGIEANRTKPVEFVVDNIRIAANVISSAYNNGIKKLLYFGSNCMYPRECPQPMKEDHILTGPFEPTNAALASAKIAALQMVRAYNAQHGTNYIVAIPSNIYGPHDNFDPNRSHFFSGLIRKFHDAKEKGDPGVILWGTGNPRREALYVDDLADASLLLMDSFSSSDPINIGTGNDYTIAEVASAIQRVVGYSGEIFYDSTKPDGMPRKLLDSSKLVQMGWRPKVSLEEGLRKTYDWYVTNKN